MMDIPVFVKILRIKIGDVFVEIPRLAYDNENAGGQVKAFPPTSIKSIALLRIQ